MALLNQWMIACALRKSIIKNENKLIHHAHATQGRTEMKTHDAFKLEMTVSNSEVSMDIGL